MPGGSITIIVLVFCLLDAVLVGGVIVPAIVRSTWGALATRFPAHPPLPGAVTREFQSFKLGVVSLGWSIHVDVDADHLHLRPAKLARAMGCRPMSVPWSQTRPVGRPGRTTRSVMIGSTRVTGPAWCLALAGDPPPGR